MTMKYSAILGLLDMLLAVQLTQFRLSKSSFSSIKFSLLWAKVDTNQAL